MKDELVQKVTTLHDALKELDKVWSKMDWSIVPETVSEQYPFHQELGKIADGVNSWLDTIKKS